MTVLGRASIWVALTTLLAGCGGGTQSAQPSPAVAAAPSAGPTVEVIEPADVGTATAKPATVGPEPSNAAGSTVTPRPDPTVTSTATDTLRLTIKDAGRTVTVAPGTVIVVELNAGPGSFRTPTTDTPRVLRTDSTRGGYPAQGAAVATFTAIAAGTARVVSTTDAACFHSQPACRMPVRQFTVTIRVST